MNTLLILIGLTPVFLYIAYRYVKKIPTYETCQRCGWDLPEEQVNKNGCSGCKGLTDKQANELLKNLKK